LFEQDEITTVKADGKPDESGKVEVNKFGKTRKFDKKKSKNWTKNQKFYFLYNLGRNRKIEKLRRRTRQKQ